MWKAVMLKQADVYASLALEVSVVSHTVHVASMENLALRNVTARIMDHATFRRENVYVSVDGTELTATLPVGRENLV